MQKTEQYKNSLPFMTQKIHGLTKLTLPLLMLRHHVAMNTEVQPLQSWLQFGVQALTQVMVHSKGPQEEGKHWKNR